MPNESYDVLRFIADGRRMHIGMDCVDGVLLADWVSHADVPEASLLWSQCRCLAMQLEAYHRAGIAPGYQYLSPYSVVVDARHTEKWYLLDTRSKANEKLLDRIRRTDVRSVFLPPGQQAYQNVTERTDLYGFGKLIQYVLFKKDPPMTRQEIRNFQKIISISLEAHGLQKAIFRKHPKKEIQNFQQIINLFSRKDKKKITVGRKSVQLLALGGISAAAAAAVVYGMQQGAGKSVRLTADEASVMPVGEEEKRDAAEEKDACYLELGLSCLLELGDLGKSRAYIRRMEKEEGAKEQYLKLLDDLEGKNRLEEQEFLKTAASAEQSVPVREEEALLYVEGLMELYIRHDSEESLARAVRLGEAWLQKEVWKKEDKGGKQEKMIREMLMHSYDKREEKEKWEAQCIWLTTHTESTEETENIYGALAQYYADQGKWSLAEEICVEGIRKHTETKALRLLMIRLACQDPGLPQEEAAARIGRQLEEMPELQAEVDCQKLMRDYGITKEGEEICIKK